MRSSNVEFAEDQQKKGELKTVVLKTDMVVELCDHHNCGKMVQVMTVVWRFLS